MKVQPYLIFEGRCEEAINFYRNAIGAQVLMLMKFKDSPDPEAAKHGVADKVMHAALRVGETEFLASDGDTKGKPEFRGFSMALGVSTEAEADKAFAALGEGGQVHMPLVKTFFSPKFGMLQDKFGITWMVLVGK